MHILLLEDDIDLGQAVVDHLDEQGHTVDWMKLCRQADDYIAHPEIELTLMDLSLPDGDATNLLRAWQLRGELRPVIVLTGRSEISERIRVLQAGADDCLVKPFDLDELSARIESVARRASLTRACGGASKSIQLDLENKIAQLDGQRVDLTAMEWALLGCLASRPGHTLSRPQIQAELARVGRGDADSNSLEVIVSRLRRKIGTHMITTHRGLGYRYENA